MLSPPEVRRWRGMPRRRGPFPAANLAPDRVRRAQAGAAFPLVIAWGRRSIGEVKVAPWFFGGAAPPSGCTALTWHQETTSTTNRLSDGRRDPPQTPSPATSTT